MNRKCLAGTLDIIFTETSGLTLYRKREMVLGLCGYYSPDGIPEGLQPQLLRLSCQIQTMYVLDKLLGALEEGRSNHFRWEPHFFNREHAAREELTLSPAFHIQKGDDSSLVQEIANLRKELNRDPVDISSLMSYICKKAKEAGDLNFKQEE